ncbi:hypothetical protein RB195_016132 [Necator americanus]|uniref:DB module n=1 Tax=Necator americanus TaxID=51031 RepID=A0ABR1E7R3_NECAM
MLVLLLGFLAVGSFSAQERFRTILIERACRQRPSLRFCTDFDPLPTVPTDNPSPKLLVTPPPIEADPKSQTSTAATVITSTLSERNLTTGEVDFNNSTKNDERLGSLLRLPKPKQAHEEFSVPPSEISSSASSPQSDVVQRSSTTAGSIEDEKSVMVFVSEYCVVHRERFVKNCHGDVNKDELLFCNSYPAACSSTAGVIPVVAYCQRYYKHYPKFCAGSKIEHDVLQFCFAFEQFCLPELTPAQPVTRPQTSIRKCEDVVAEARKVCNPFPHPRDTFNVLRCSNFLTHCKKFVDWA